jgi:hypothetical protein
MPSTQVPLLYTPGACCTLPPFPPPPYLYTSESCKAFSLSTSPPLRGKGMFSTFRLGGGRGSKADTSLFPVSADHMRGSSKLKLSSIEAHGHTGSPPLLGHPWQKQHMEVHMAISKHVGTPPSRRGTDGILVGRHINGLRKHFVAKPTYCKRAFLVCIPKMGRSSAVPPSGHTGSHAPLIHPHTNKQKQGRPPRQPRGNGGRGGTHSGSERTNC